MVSLSIFPQKQVVYYYVLPNCWNSYSAKVCRETQKLLSSAPIVEVFYKMAVSRVSRRYLWTTCNFSRDSPTSLLNNVRMKSTTEYHNMKILTLVISRTIFFLAILKSTTFWDSLIANYKHKLQRKFVTCPLNMNNLLSVSGCTYPLNVHSSQKNTPY